MIHCLVFTSCKTEDDTIVYKDTRRWVEKTVAVVAPLSDPIMKARLERTAEWMPHHEGPPGAHGRVDAQ